VLDAEALNLEHLPRQFCRAIERRRAISSAAPI
jgi:hypothetical protein